MSTPKTNTNRATDSVTAGKPVKPGREAASTATPGTLGARHAGGHSDVANKRPLKLDPSHLTGEAAINAYKESISPKGMAAAQRLLEQAQAKRDIQLGINKPTPKNTAPTSPASKSKSGDGNPLLYSKIKPGK